MGVENSNVTRRFVNVSGKIRLAFKAIMERKTAAGKMITMLYGNGTARIKRVLFEMSTPETATDTATLTAAQMLSGILVATPTAAAAYTTLTGTLLLAALPELTPGDAFDLTIINLGGTGDDITFTAGTDVSIVGDPVVGPVADVATEQMSSGTFRIRYVTGTTFVAYRVA